MTESPQQLPKDPHRFPPEEGGYSFVEHHHIPPIVFVVAVLAIILALYQIGGGIITYLIAGAGLTEENVHVVRLLTVAAQIWLILLPTLGFALLWNVDVRELFSFRIPGVVESTLALFALFSLQRVMDAYLFFQDKIPLPQQLVHILDPLKKAMEQMVGILVHAGSVPELLLVIAIVALVPAVVEELLFRGLVQRVFEHMIPPLAAAVVAGIIFGIYHLNPFDIVPLVGLGILFGIFRYRSDSLIVPMSAHFFNNLTAVLAEYFGLNNDSAQQAVHGSPSASSMLIELIVFGAIFIWVFRMYLRSTERPRESFHGEG